MALRSAAPLPALALLAAASLLAPSGALAAESYDNCAGTINTLPAVITTQGVWCMKKDLTTLSASGAAITVTAPNVTIECNGFKLGGLGAGPETQAIGILGDSTTNLAVRGCNIRGFFRGVQVNNTSGGGHLIENNRFDGNTRYGIWLFGDGSVVRNNTVLDTGGGATAAGNVSGGIVVLGAVDVIDNLVRGVVGEPGSPEFAIGIYHGDGFSGVIARNRVSGVVPDASGFAHGIYSGSSHLAIRENVVTNATATSAIYCLVNNNLAYGNMRTGPGTTLGLCNDAGANTGLP